MKVISKLLGLSLFVVGCATGGGAQPLAARVGRTRSLQLEGPATRSVVSGPSVIHAYSANGGARLFTADAVTATDQDCQRARSRAGASEAHLRADQVVTFDVPAGRVACVETTSAGAHELLWHQTNRPQTEGALLARSK